MTIDFRYSISIDIGTTFSGFAFYHNNAQDIHIYNGIENIKKLFPLTYVEYLALRQKDYSSLLLSCENTDGQKYFGTKAIHKNIEKDSAGFFFKDGYKLSLIDEKTKCVTYNGNKSNFSAKELIAEYLKLLKDQALQELKERENRQIPILENTILWIISVPVHWGNRDESNIGQKLMLECATEAGLTNVRLILEPIAAALSLHTEDILEQDGIFVFIDSGGGTTDIVSMRCKNSKLTAIDEVSPTSTLTGSTKVDKQFCSYLYDNLRISLESIKRNHKREYLELMMNWELAKCNFNPDTEFDYVEINIPRHFAEHFTEYRRDSLTEEIYRGGKLRIPKPIMRGFFTESINGIVDQLNQQIEALENCELNCDRLIFMGGYSNAKTFQRTILEKFETNDKIHFIEQDGCSVLRGASRISRFENILQFIDKYTIGDEVFPDIAGNFAKSFIKELIFREIMFTDENLHFRPADLMTRAEFAEVLNRAFPKMPRDKGEKYFSDISSHTKQDHIKEVCAKGFMRGNNNEFSPNKDISRKEVFVAFSQGLNPKTDTYYGSQLSSYYNDANIISEWARDSIAFATKNRLVVNHPDLKSLEPERPATRAEIAAIIYQALVFQSQAEPISSEYIVERR